MVEFKEGDRVTLRRNGDRGVVVEIVWCRDAGWPYDAIKAEMVRVHWDYGIASNVIRTSLGHTSPLLLLAEIDLPS